MSVQSIRRTTAEHYTWGDNCDAWHLVKNSNLSVIEEQMPAGTFETRHYHLESEQFFYILDGEALMDIDGNPLRMSAGEGIHVPHGTVHQISNCSECPVRFLVISRPPSHGDRVNTPG